MRLKLPKVTKNPRSADAPAEDLCCYDLVFSEDVDTHNHLGLSDPLNQHQAPQDHQCLD